MEFDRRSRTRAEPVRGLPPGFQAAGGQPGFLARRPAPRRSAQASPKTPRPRTWLAAQMLAVARAEVQGAGSALPRAGPRLYLASRRLCRHRRQMLARTGGGRVCWAWHAPRTFQMTRCGW